MYHGIVSTSTKKYQSVMAEKGNGQAIITSPFVKFFAEVEPLPVEPASFESYGEKIRY